MRDKIDAMVSLHLEEPLKQAIQDLAMADDLAVSEWIRIQLRMVVKMYVQGTPPSRFVASVGDATAEHEVRRDSQRTSRK